MTTTSRAIILAAGRGSRMAGLTDDRPKAMLPLRGRPLIEWQIDALTTAGIGEIAVVTGYRRELLSPFGLTEFHNPRWSDTNMVSSLACAAPWLEQGACLVCYSDLYYEAPGLSALIECDAHLAITYDPNWEALWRARFGDPLSDAETFRLNSDGTVAEIGGTPSTLAEIQGQYMGLLRYTPEGWRRASGVWRALPPVVADKTHMTGLLQRVIDAAAVPVRAVAYTGTWGEFDSPADLAALEGRS
jgi:choline kinase